MRYLVGAYATSPNVSGWNAALESDYFQKLKAIPQIGGLEHPFLGTLHPHDDDWFLANIDPNWQFVFTCVPGNMNALGENPHFGIASDDEAGRQQALNFMQQAKDAVAKLNAHLGRKAVIAVEIQTAPNRSKASGSANALKQSIQTMQAWDWQGAQLVIEHCDTLVANQTPAKGFLDLQDEIAVITELNQNVHQTSNPPVAMVVNWGRSAIETRSVDGVIEHINLIKQHGLLRGLMFSGVSDQNTEYGAWKDSHMPPALSEKLVHGAAHSLMTEAQMHRCLKASESPSLAFVGIKLGIRPKDMPLEQRLGTLSDTLAALDRYYE